MQSKSNPIQSPAINPKVKAGDRIRCFLDNGTLDEVVYTVQGLARKGRQWFPWVSDQWQPFMPRNWVKVP